MNSNEARKRHDKLVENLATRLRSNPRYVSVDTLVEYELGEVDVLAQTIDGWWHVYEVKGRNCNVRFNKAVNQLSRYGRVHDYRNIKAVYYSPEKVKRIY